MASKVDTLKRLDQATIAWALSTSARSVRDMADVPRRADGAYDLQQVVAWWRGRIAPPELSDAQVERLLVAIEHMTPQTEWTALVIADELRRLVGEHGDGAAALFVRLLIETWQSIYSDYRDALTSEDPADMRHRIERQLEDQRAAFASNTRLEEPHVCGRCGRLRRGRRWIEQKTKQSERGHSIEDLCPACMKGGGPWRES